MSIKKVNKVVLKKKAEDNTNTVKSTVVSQGVKSEEVLKEGIPLEHDAKRVEGTIGMSKGLTLNMGDYQSARIDCWLTVPLDEGSYMEQYNELSKIIDEQLQIEGEKIKDM